jgi:UDP-N-acetylglucosamine 4-epimerase
VPQRESWLVTGAAGFIGSHLVEQLLSLGQRVVALDNFSTGKPRNLDLVRERLTPDQWGQLAFYEADIRDHERMQGLMQEHRPTIVLHQAALGSVPRSLETPLVSHASNVDGFISLLEAARQAGVKRFVYASSSSVYGDIEDSSKVEQRVGTLLSPYAATKKINEVYAQVFGKAYGIETIGLRYFNVFGPRQDPEGPYAAVIPRWLAAMDRQESCVMYGDGTTSRDFCYVANVVQANLLAGKVSAQSPVINQVVNIACGATTSLNQLFELLRRAVATRKGTAVESIPDAKRQPFRKGDILHSLADTTLARSALGYAPTHSVEEGIAELVERAL